MEQPKTFVGHLLNPVTPIFFLLVLICWSFFLVVVMFRRPVELALYSAYMKSDIHSEVAF